MKKTMLALLAVILTVGMVVSFSLIGCKTAVSTETTAVATTAAATTQTSETTASETTSADETTTAKQMVLNYTLPWGPVNPATAAFNKTVSDWAVKKDIIIKSVVVGEDVNKQSNIIDTWIAENNVDGFVMIPVDSESMVAAVQRANDAGLLVGCLDRVVLDGKVVGTVACDNYAAAKVAGENAVKLLTAKYGSAKGTILELQGDLSAETIKQRSTGFNDVISQYADIKVIQKPTKWDLPTCYNAVIDTLTAHPELDLIYWHSDLLAPSIYSALTDSKKLIKVGDPGHIILVGFDGQSVTLDNIRQGYVDGEVNQPLGDYGVILDFMVKAFAGSPYKAGDQIVEEGSYWSPATITEGLNGPELLLAPKWLDKTNVDDSTLWGNIYK